MIMAGMALAGAGISILGQMSKAQEEKRQARLHKQKLEFEARTSKALFDLNFPILQQQQRANRGEMATHAAKGNVAVESMSVVALLSEQARIDSVNQSLAKFQQAAEQQGLAFEKSETKESIRRANLNLILGVAGSLVGGASEANKYGVFKRRSSTSSSSSLSVLQPRNSSLVYGPPTADGRNPG